MLEDKRANPGGPWLRDLLPGPWRTLLACRNHLHGLVLAGRRLDGARVVSLPLVELEMQVVAASSLRVDLDAECLEARILQLQDVSSRGQHQRVRKIVEVAGLTHVAAVDAHRGLAWMDVKLEVPLVASRFSERVRPRSVAVGRVAVRGVAVIVIGIAPGGVEEERTEQPRDEDDRRTVMTVAAPGSRPFGDDATRSVARHCHRWGSRSGPCDGTTGENRACYGMDPRGDGNGSSRCGR